jgi:FKBP-type peptidyl-prolyl cis-trans isomerase
MHLSTSALLLACALAVPVTNAWMPTTQTRSTTSLHAAISRQDFFQQAAATAVVGATAAGIFQPLSAMAAGEVVALPNGVTYTVTKKGDGPKPDIGELAAIRFKAYFGEVKIDDIFDTPEPYYTRVGSGALVKGVEDILPMMVLGDRWVLTIPVSTVNSNCFVLWAMCHKYCRNCTLLGTSCTHLRFIIFQQITERLGVWQKGPPFVGRQAPNSR